MGRMMNDMKCRLIQKAVYAKLYKGHQPNEWEPWKEPGTAKTDDGIICKNDVKYGNTFVTAIFPAGSTLLTSRAMNEAILLQRAGD